MDVSAELRSLRRTLAPLAERSAAARRAIDVLDRDLLPRTAGGDSALVAGIVGPNNAGKSALFNSLIGRALSPSLPAGGATRRLIGALHPTLLARLRAEPTLARFRLREIGAAEAGQPVQAALASPDDPTELLVWADASLPENAMLIDTPDFDSIVVENRLASESLLAVADLVVAVVTRHSYQNQSVVEFLEHWLTHGRPWLLVYNEAPDVETVRSHAVKLAADVGSAPLGVFLAPHSLAVQAGAAALEPRSLDGGHRLHDELFDPRRSAEVKRRASAAAMGRLRDELEQLASDLEAEALQAGELLEAAESRAFVVAQKLAAAAMPAAPFVEAFRSVLDRRTNAVSRSWRSALRRVRLQIERLPRALRGARSAEGDTADGNAALLRLESEELRRLWPTYWEELARDLGPEARHAARRSASEDSRARLDDDLADARLGPARDEAATALLGGQADTEPFRAACEKLFERAIEDRGFSFDIQAAADVASLLPIAMAAAVILKTGGLGTDIAVAGGGAASTFLVEKYIHVLGKGLMNEARRRWAELRGREIARGMTDAALPTTAPVLRAAAARDASLAHELRAARARLGEPT